MVKRSKRHTYTLKAGNAEMIWTPSRSVHCDEASQRSLSTMMVKSAHTSTSADQSRYALTPFIYSPFIDILEFSSVTRLPNMTVNFPSLTCLHSVTPEVSYLTNSPLYIYESFRLSVRCPSFFPPHKRNWTTWWFEFKEHPT